MVAYICNTSLLALTRDRVNMRNPTEGSLGVEKELVVYVYSRTQFGHYNEQTASCRSLKKTKDAKFRKWSVLLAGRRFAYSDYPHVVAYAYNPSILELGKGSLEVQGLLAQWVRALAAIPEDLGSAFSTHPTTPLPGGLMPSWVLHECGAHAHSDTKIKLVIFKKQVQGWLPLTHKPTS